MKKILIFVGYLLLIISLNLYGKDMEGENKMEKDIDFGLTINNKYFPVPITLEKLIKDGWKISDETPYFLNPLVGEDYYEVRKDWSLSEDKKSIIKGGKIIRLLEKDGIFLEVTITNQNISEDDEQYQKIEEGVVNSILVFYNKMINSIKLNNRELRDLTPDILIKDYSLNDGWQHIPTNYRNHPEFGISTEYTIDNNKRSISIYFDLENKPFKVEILNETPLKNIEN
ncbi:MAG: hypothetical protein MR673_04095 [Fusobacterium perfoetens]|uniref:hypothetical protein n=1 Tax=Fusobacterium perfoetens TaxID=852 RepID=UPI0023F2AA1F|nr:hypothetical protein [Fusobacterium perfoetens]MCI6152293.1 hypothetical protein [Fusobacterium perfoetens]MDY3238151.1 hypothetical protein [Fusobacterium perfoetens]